MMDLVLLGPPGAGKGTLASDMGQHFRVKHISTGDLLRAAIKADTQVGKEAEVYMKQGSLVPDPVIFKLIQEALPENQGVLFDGFPRNVAQAKDLQEVLKKRGRALHRVVNLQLSDAEVIQRLSGRRQCAECGAIFHVVNHPPKHEGVCDQCGGEIYQRADDQEATIRKRISVYHEQTQPLIQYYQEAGLLLAVDAGGKPEKVAREVAAKLEGGRA